MGLQNAISCCRNISPVVLRPYSILTWILYTVYQYGLLLGLQEKCHQTALWEKTKGQKFDPQLSFGLALTGWLGTACVRCADGLFFIRSVDDGWDFEEASWQLSAVAKLLTVSIFPALVSAEMPSTAGQGSSKIEIVKTYIFFGVTVVIKNK